MSGCILHLSSSHSPVFLLNSCLDLFSAPPSLEDPLSRGYGVSLPSSLTVIHSSALVYSTRLRVSVCGTGACRICLADFLGSLITGSIARPRGGRRTIALRLRARTSLRPSAPLRFNAPFRRCAAVPLLRPRVAPHGSTGMLTRYAIACALRLRLRTRLTPG